VLYSNQDEGGERVGNDDNIQIERKDNIWESKGKAHMLPSKRRRVHESKTRRGKKSCKRGAKDKG
jgi:hypothetical protein